jgi:hypothetical protein
MLPLSASHKSGAAEKNATTLALAIGSKHGANDLFRA